MSESEAAESTGATGPTPARRTLALRIACVAFGTVALLWPALYNGFPLTFQDSGYYLARLFDHRLHPGRALGYVYFADAFAVGGSVWPIVAAQSVLTSVLLLRSTELLLGGAGRRAAFVAIGGIVLSSATGGAKYASWIMADVATSWIFLAGLILFLSVRPAERIAAGAIALFSVTAHNTHLPLALGMAGVVSTAVLLRFWSISCARRSTRRVLIVALLGAAAVPALGVLSGEPPATVRGGGSFLLYRFIDTGVAVETLDRYCAEKDWVSCQFRDEYAQHQGLADGWFLFRPGSPFHTGLKGWAGEEQDDIVAHAFRCCWPRILTTTVAGALRQFFTVDSADGLRPIDTGPATSFLWHGGSAEVAQIRASRQAKGSLGLPVLHPFPEVPLLAAALAVALFLAAVPTRRGSWRSAWFYSALILFLAGNATVCAFGSTLHARYQGRISWLLFWSLPILFAWWLEAPGSSRDSNRPEAAPRRSSNPNAYAERDRQGLRHSLSDPGSGASRRDGPVE